VGKIKKYFFPSNLLVMLCLIPNLHDTFKNNVCMFTEFRTDVKCALYVKCPAAIFNF
jgi:hypothetical protein